MRAILLSVSLISASSLRVCGSAESGPQAAASANVAVSGGAAASAALTPAKARIGGQVVVAGNHSVELLIHQAGLVEATVSDASGQPVSDGIGLSLIASSTGQAKESIALAFSAPRARFEGQAKAGVTLAPGPAELTLSVAGKPVQTKLDAALVVKGPELGGSLIVVGDHSAEVLVRTGGEVLAFVRDRAGAAVHATAGLSLSANVRTAAGASENIQLAFDAARKCFAGHAKAGVELAPGPIELSITGKAGVALGGLSQIALRADAVHGGEVLVVGDYSVELVAQGKELHAYVFDAAGKASADANLDLRLNLAALANPNVALKWDAPSASYVAELDGKVDFDAQPIRMTLTAAGRAFAGAAASLGGVMAARIAPPKLSADAKLDAKADANAKLDAKAKLAADAKLKVPEVKSNLSASAAKSASAAIQAKVTPPKVTVEKSASASVGSKAGAGAKASAGFSLGIK